MAFHYELDHLDEMVKFQDLVFAPRTMYVLFSGHSGVINKHVMNVQAVWLPSGTWAIRIHPYVAKRLLGTSCLFRTPSCSTVLHNLLRYVGGEIEVATLWAQFTCSEENTISTILKGGSY